MTDNQREKLDELLEKLSKEDCEIVKGISSTCSIDCPYYINGAYGGACAIGIVQENIYKEW